MDPRIYQGKELTIAKGQLDSILAWKRVKKELLAGQYHGPDFIHAVYGSTCNSDNQTDLLYGHQLEIVRGLTYVVRKATSLYVSLEDCLIRLEAITEMWRANRCEEHRICRFCEFGYVEEKMHE